MERFEVCPRHGQEECVLHALSQWLHTEVMSLVMRLGKPLEHLQSALRATASTGPMGEQITTIGRQLGYAGYLAYDSIIWVSHLDTHIYMAVS
jgi:hypothetical protein